MSREERQRKIAAFVYELERCSAGELALLRRNVGKRWQDDPRCAWFTAIVPEGESEDIAFLVATLMAQYKTATIKDEKRREHVCRGNFGRTFARVIAKSHDQGWSPLRILEDCRKDEKRRKPVPSIVRRMYVLLDADFDPRYGGDLPYRLLQLVRMSVDKNVGIDWARLFIDLDSWSHPDRWVQKEWARKFFAPLKDQEADPEAPTDTSSRPC